MALIVAITLFLASSLPVVTTEHYVDSSPHGWCSVDIRYPRVSGMSDSAVQSKINRELHESFVEGPEREYSYSAYDAFGTNVVNPSMIDCEKRMMTLTRNMRRTGRTGFRPTDWHASYNLSEWFRVGSTGPTIVSIAGDGVEGFDPSAHPTDYWWTVNIDVSDGKVLGFNDIFRTDEAHVKRLDDLIAADLQRDPDAAEDHLVWAFRNKNFRGSLQPLVCHGQIRFFDLIDVHAMAAVTAFVSGHDLIAAGIVKDPLVLGVLKEPRRTSDTCGQFF